MGWDVVGGCGSLGTLVVMQGIPVGVLGVYEGGQFPALHAGGLAGDWSDFLFPSSPLGAMNRKDGQELINR